MEGQTRGVTIRNWWTNYVRGAILPEFTITGLTTAILVILMLMLSAGVIKSRHDNQISLGDQGDKLLERRVRAFGNFTEYVPMSLILIGLLEWRGGPAVIFACALLVARLSHAFSFYQNGGAKRHFLFRRIGMLLQLGVLLGGALTLLVMSF